jgi:hypothetical protein
VRVLVGHYPGSILERDADGQLPLHLACTDIDTSFDNPILREVLQFLVDASPESCRERARATPYALRSHDYDAFQECHRMPF